jgi:predicted transglutaminase-like cysteine proteinase
MRRFHAHIPAAAILVAVCTLAGMAMAASYPQLFGSREVRSAGIGTFKKWTGTLARYFDERPMAEGPCTATKFNACHLREWQGVIDGLRDKPPMAQMGAINAYVNRRRYVVDPINWGRPDYWATPAQFFRKNGDCEDYAIAKFLSLRALGYANEDMRIVILQDLNLGIPHAVLVVYLLGHAFVLDNQTAVVMAAERIHHYQPIYSLNETHWWLHKGG